MRHMRCSLIKQCKTSVVKPSENFINRTASYLLQRTITHEHLIFIQQPKIRKTISLCSSKEVDNKIEVNIHAQMNKACLLTTERDNRGLINPFTKEKAEGLKHYHLLNFRQIGGAEYLLRVECRTGIPSLLLKIFGGVL